MRRVRGWLFRFLGVFRKSRSERHIADEIDAHLESHIREGLNAGLTGREARRQALIRLGGVEATKERWRDQRGIPVIENAVRDLVYGLRMLRGHRGWTLVAVFCLAVGVGANTAVFSVADAVLLKPLKVPEPDRLVALRSNRQMPGGGVAIYGTVSQDEPSERVNPSFSLAVFERLRLEQPALESLFAFAPTGFERVRIGEAPESDAVTAQFVSGNFYEGLGVAPLSGRFIVPDDDRPDADPVAVISAEFWKRRFGSDRTILGSVIFLDDTAATIVGIAPDGLGDALHSGRPTPDVSVPLARQSRLNGMAQPRNYSWLTLMGRMPRGTSREEAQAALSVVFDGIVDDLADFFDPGEERPRLIVVSASHGAYDVPDVVTAAIGIISALFALVLTIATSNLCNLLLARFETRRDEILTRFALGASRHRLVAQCLTESVLIAALGLTGGLLLAAAILRALPLGSYQIGNPALDSTGMVFALSITVMCLVFFGLVPAFRATRHGTSLELRSGRLARGRSRLGKVVVSGQVALTLILLIVSGLFLNTLNNLRSVNVGFNPDDLLIFSLTMPSAEDARTRLTTRLTVASRVRNLPGVESVTLTSGTLLGSGFVRYGFSLEEATEEETSATVLWVDDAFLQTMETPLLQGRDFVRRDLSDGPPVVLLNESFRKEFLAGEDPLGHGLTIQGDDARVVGVFRDTYYGDLRSGPTPMVLVASPEQLWRADTFVVRTESAPEALAPDVRRVVAALRPGLGVTGLTSQAAEIRRMYGLEEMFAIASTAFGGLALLISMVGLFGLMAYVVAGRTREIGIRMAVGARAVDVGRAVLGESLILLMVGGAVGLGCALGLTRYLESFLFGLSPVDPSTIVQSVVVLGVVGLIAAAIPAHRAARVDPVIALRHE